MMEFIVFVGLFLLFSIGLVSTEQDGVHSHTTLPKGKNKTFSPHFLVLLILLKEFFRHLRTYISHGHFSMERVPDPYAHLSDWIFQLSKL